MGQKVNPTGFRTGILYDWQSTWYAGKHQYADLVAQDHQLRVFLEDKLKLAGLSQVDIKRSINTIDIYVHVSRPGVVIGRGGANIDELKLAIFKLVNKKGQAQVTINLHPLEIQQPDLSATLIASQIAYQLERRYPHRRAKDQAIEKVIGAGAKGIKIVFSGRIGGTDIGRTEKYTSGKIPTSTLRADIDYAQIPALTRSGFVGIKVWIYKGEKQTR
jgi:small subunit ribosomal protein S3